MKRRVRGELNKDLIERLKNLPPLVYTPNSLALQLGLYIGDEIAYKHLPTLSTDMLQGHPKKVIQVNEEDTKEHERLEKIWYSKTHDKEYRENKKYANKEWNEHLKFMKFLQDKYLPKTIEIVIPRVDWNSEEELKDIKVGIIRSLWNCDFCNYKCELDEFEIRADSWPYHSKIKLEVDLSYKLAEE